MTFKRGTTKEWYVLEWEKGICSSLSGLLLFFFLIQTISVTAQDIAIEGTVVLERSQSVPAGISIGGYQTLTSGGSSGSEPSSQSILIWLEDFDENTVYEPQDTTLQILDQVNKQFMPRLMGVRVGGAVRIQNSDPVYHNVFSLSPTKRFDVGRRSPRDYQDVVFDRVGTVDVFCDIHSDMHAVIRVLPENTVAWQKLESSGTFRFENIPEGDYTLHFLALGDRSETVDITATGTDMITLETIRLGTGL